MNKHMLVIMGHGSRRAEANEEFRQIVKAIRVDSLTYDDIQYCFLELANPRFSTVIEKAISRGYSDFDLYPLFFYRGNHVERDIPENIVKVTTAHPDITIRLLDYFGQHQGLANTIIEHILQQV